MDDPAATDGADAMESTNKPTGATNETGIVDKRSAWNARSATSPSAGSAPGSKPVIGARVSLLSNQSTTLSMLVRARSIQRDAAYIKQIAHELGNPPIVANERCGSWYVPSELKADSVYFKSTDGHRGQWDFSTRRLNVGLLHVLGRNGLCIVVDATRGRRMPDALSKAIPIWCAVWNRVLFPEQTKHHSLQTDQRCVSNSEHLGIEARLDHFVALAQNLPLDFLTLRKALCQPIVPHFYYRPDAAISLQDLPSSAKHLVCLSASLGQSISTEDEVYVPGAGDDAEHWARGLTPELFWKNQDRLNTDLREEDFLLQADAVVSEDYIMRAEAQGDEVLPKPIRLAPDAPLFYIGLQTAIGQVRSGDLDVDAIISCVHPETAGMPTDESLFRRHRSVQSAVAPTAQGRDQPNADDDARRVDNSEAALFIGASDKRIPVLQLRTPKRKLGSRALRAELHRVTPFLRRHFGADIKDVRSDEQDRAQAQQSDGAERGSVPVTSQPRLLFTCATGPDLAIGVALAVACRHYDQEGRFMVDGVEWVGDSARTESVMTEVNDERDASRKPAQDSGKADMEMGKDLGKAFVRQRLVQILDQTGRAYEKSVQRATLRAVNEFVLMRPKQRREISETSWKGSLERIEPGMAGQLFSSRSSALQEMLSSDQGFIED